MSDPAAVAQANIANQQDLPSWQKMMKDPYFGYWFPIWINNAMENYPIIKEEFRVKDRCLTSHPRPMGRPCLVIGRGASTNKLAPILKKWQHPTIAASSNAAFCVKYGHEPTYICAFDSVVAMNEKLKPHKWERSTLLTHPNIDPKMIKGWKWEKLYYRRMFPGIEFFELYYPMMYPFVKIGIRFTGSVVNNAVSVATFLGFNPIFLIGSDLSWKDCTASTCENYYFNPDGSLTYKDSGPTDLQSPVYLHPYGPEIFTEEKMLNFKEGLLQLWAADNPHIVDCSGGILTELPQANIEDVIKNQGRGFANTNIPQQQKMEALQKFVAWEREYIEEQKKVGYVSPQ